MARKGFGMFGRGSVRIYMARRHQVSGEFLDFWPIPRLVAPEILGMTGRDPNTLADRAILARTHLIPALGRRRLVDLSAEEVEASLASKAGSLSSDTPARLLGILRAAIRRAQARDYVKPNVALLCGPPKGRAGRQSKSLDVYQAARLVAAAFADETVMRAYVIVSLLTGARTEERRALTWRHVESRRRPTHRFPCGDRYAPAGTPKPRGLGALLSCRVVVWRCCGSTQRAVAGPGCGGTEVGRPRSGVD